MSSSLSSGELSSSSEGKGEEIVAAGTRRVGFGVKSVGGGGTVVVIVWGWGAQARIVVVVVEGVDCAVVRWKKGRRRRSGRVLRSIFGVFG